MSVSIKEVMTTSPVMPVMVINQIEHAVPLACALVEGGLKVLEITLRTSVALECIRRIKAEVPDAIVGAGTIINTQTPSEVMRLLEKGITAMKFFPAEAAGGIPMLKSIGGPLPQIMFCPTGGVNLNNAPDYLALSNVACVGGSWMAPADLVDAENWAEITRRAAEATALRK
jgi:2-dehydro-3-deoxyphosphogluconate aldolase / (4S)-4-hydroxy-2-oxoglutarate aldolase